MSLLALRSYARAMVDAAPLLPQCLAPLLAKGVPLVFDGQFRYILRVVDNVNCAADKNQANGL